jgi:hypothetical protein
MTGQWLMQLIDDHLMAQPVGGAEAQPRMMRNTTGGGHNITLAQHNADTQDGRVTAVALRTTRQRQRSKAVN